MGFASSVLRTFGVKPPEGVLDEPNEQMEKANKSLKEVNEGLDDIRKEFEKVKADEEMKPKEKVKTASNLLVSTNDVSEGLPAIKEQIGAAIAGFNQVIPNLANAGTLEKIVTAARVKESVSNGKELQAKVTEASTKSKALIEELKAFIEEQKAKAEGEPV